ncbi:MAG: type II secretion system F family protein [Chloroflexi bacterium]|nr:type II secretion system F family protein [Chloroflexota bacterium]
MNRPAEIPRTRELIVLCRQLGTMLSAGTEIRRALLIVRDQMSQPDLQNALETAHNDMELGWTLAHSLGRSPTLFSPFFIDMIRQGEGEGTLGSVLDDLATYLEKQLRMESELVAPAASSVAAVLPAAATRHPETIYRLAAWIGVGLGCSSVGWAYAASGASGYAGFAATVLAVGLSLAGWALLELRLARAAIGHLPAEEPREDRPALDEGVDPVPGGASDWRAAGPTRGNGANTPETPASTNDAQKTPPRGQPNASKPGTNAGRSPSGPPFPPIAGDRRSMPM